MNKFKTLASITLIVAIMLTLVSMPVLAAENPYTQGDYNDEYTIIVIEEEEENAEEANEFYVTAVNGVVMWSLNVFGGSFTGTVILTCSLAPYTYSTPYANSSSGMTSTGWATTTGVTINFHAVGTIATSYSTDYVDYSTSVFSAISSEAEMEMIIAEFVQAMN